MNITSLSTALQEQVTKRIYVHHLEIFEQTTNLIKARLYIASNLFVQVYRNDRFDTTNLVLVYNGQRIYARDQLGGIWHRHIKDHPELHDTSEAGRKLITLDEFLDEVEMILAELNMP
jgi:hypothetical protein